MSYNKIELKSIVHASLFKRVFAIILDFLFVAILFLLTWIPSTEGLFDYGFGLNKTLDDTKLLQVQSGLYIDKTQAQDHSVVSIIDGSILADENGYYKFDSYKKYVSSTYYFYFYSPFSEEVEGKYFNAKPTLEEKNRWFNKEVLLIDKDPSKFDAYVIENNDINLPAVEFNEDMSVKKINVKPKEEIVFNSKKYARKGDNLQVNQLYITSYLKIFSDTKDFFGTYHVACNNLMNTVKYKALYKRLESIARYEAYISIAFAATVYFLIMPLFFRNGETLGMKIFGIGMVNALGYQVSKKQIFIKYLFMSIEIYVGVLTFFLFYLVDYLLLVFTKEHKSIGDFIAATIMIDTKTSVRFIDKKTEDILTAQVIENLSKSSVSHYDDSNVN